jgi:DNA-binding GntR family transcriptional regulator
MAPHSEEGGSRSRPDASIQPQQHQYTSKADMVTAALRDLILNGSFLPGEALRQRELAERFGVSPTPIREGLRRLESEGLVIFDPHRGSSVVERGVGATEENYWIRAMLEPEATALAVEYITDEDLEKLKALNAELLAGDPQTSAKAELNQEFHFLIYERAKSPVLFALIRLLWRSFPTGPQTIRPRAKSAAQHDRIIEALAKRDAVAAAEAARVHITEALQ